MRRRQHIRFVALAWLISSASVLVEPFAFAEDPLPARNSTTSRNAFRVTLPDGAAIEVVGLCESPTPRGWWRPDGSALATAPRGKTPENPRRRRNRGLIYREVAIEATLGSGSEITLSHRPTSVVRSTAGANDVETVRGVVPFSPNGDASIAVHYASKSWKILCSFNNRAAAAIETQGNHSDVVALVAPSEENGAARMVAAYKIRGIEHREVRIVAIDEENQEHVNELGPHPGAFVGEAMLLVERFPGLPLAKIREFQFQSRSFQNIEFRNVAVNPGQKTEPVIFIDGEPTYKALAPAKIREEPR